MSKVKRKIEANMVRFLDAKLAKNGLAQHAIEDQDPRTLFVCAVEACVGIREVGKNNSGPLVELIQETVGGADFEPWCMSFMQTCIAYAELKTGIESPIAVTEHCMTCWRDTPITQRVKKTPKRGAIIIWKKGSTDSGHTGIYLESLTGQAFKAIEGNTESGMADGKVERDGGGVYLTHRYRTGAGNMKIIGFLKPF